MRPTIKSPFGNVMLLDEEDEKNYKPAGPKNIVTPPLRSLEYWQQLNNIFIKNNPESARDQPTKVLSKTLPSTFSWQDKGKITSVRNQNPYGTCWAFAAIAALEASYLIYHHESVDLSEQDLINCSCRPCNGSYNTPGWVSTVDKLTKTGVTSEAFLPYKGDGNISPCDPEKVKANCGKCNSTEVMPYGIEDYGVLDANDEDHVPATVTAIKQALITHGPVVVKMHIPDGSAFIHFSDPDNNKVFKETIPLEYSPKRNNGAHIIIIVGWDDGKAAWRMKNSWGEGFGNKGFCWIAYGSNNIGMGATWYRAAMPEFRITAVWHKSNETEKQVYGWSYANYRKFYDLVWKDGWRLHLLETAVVNGKVEYSAVWRKTNNIEEIQVYDYRYADFKAEYDKLWKDGWRIHLLSNYVLNGQVYYTAVWRKLGNVGEMQYYSLHFDDYKSKNEELSKDGWRIHILNNYVLNGTVLYTAVWRNTGGAQTQVWGWKYADFRAKYEELWKDGWRLHVLSNYVVNSVVHYTAVWNKPDDKDEVQVYSYEYEDFRAKDETLRSQGYRLSIVNTYTIND